MNRSFVNQNQEVTHFVQAGILKPRSRLFSIGMERSWGSSLGSCTGAPLGFAAGFFLPPFSLAAFFSSSSFRFRTSSSVSSRYIEAITHFQTLIDALSTFKLIFLSSNYCCSAEISWLAGPPIAIIVAFLIAFRVLLCLRFSALSRSTSYS